MPFSAVGLGSIQVNGPKLTPVDCRGGCRVASVAARHQTDVSRHNDMGIALHAISLKVIFVVAAMQE